MAAPNGDAEAAAPARPGTVADANASPAVLWAYRLFPLALLPTMLFRSRDFGITWDEKTHQMYGEAAWHFLIGRFDSHWFAARTDVLHRVTAADGATLAVVVPGPAFTEIAGSPAFPARSAPALR